MTVFMMKHFLLGVELFTSRGFHFFPRPAQRGTRSDEVFKCQGIIFKANVDVWKQCSNDDVMNEQEMGSEDVRYRAQWSFA